MIIVRVRNLAGELLLEKELDSFPVAIGRDPAAKISIRDSGVSTKHAELSWDGMKITLKDVGSRNGSFFQEKEVKLISVAPPCTFLLGNVVTLEVVTPASEAAEELKARRENTRDSLPDLAQPVAGKVVAPKAFRVPTPALAKPAEEEAAQAKAAGSSEQVAEAIEIFGWEEYWHRLNRVTPWELGVVMLALSGLFFVLHYYVFRESIFDSLMEWSFETIFSIVLAAIIASIAALPGLLFRRSYDFKPLFVQSCLAMMLFSFESEIFRPAMLSESAGTFYRVLILVVVAVTAFMGNYVWLFTTIPHRFHKRTFIATGAMAVLAFVVQVQDVVTVDRQTLLRRAMLGETDSSRNLAGKVMEVRDLTDEIKEFGKSFPPK